MKLESKHTSVYLPYKIKAYFKEANDRYCRKYVIGTVHAVYDDASITCYDTVNSTPDKFKLILRPLSDLTKEIEVNGEKLIFSNFYLSKNELDTINKCLEMNLNLLDFISANVLNKMLEYHFDVYGLIENGLAIDINTLNK